MDFNDPTNQPPFGDDPLVNQRPFGDDPQDNLDSEPETFEIPGDRVPPDPLTQDERMTSTLYQLVDEAPTHLQPVLHVIMSNGSIDPQLKWIAINDILAPYPHVLRRVHGDDRIPTRSTQEIPQDSSTFRNVTGVNQVSGSESESSRTNVRSNISDGNLTQGTLEMFERLEAVRQGREFLSRPATRERVQNARSTLISTFNNFRNEATRAINSQANSSRTTSTDQNVSTQDTNDHTNNLNDVDVSSIHGNDSNSPDSRNNNRWSQVQVPPVGQQFTDRLPPHLRSDNNIVPPRNQRTHDGNQPPRR